MSVRILTNSGKPLYTFRDRHLEKRYWYVQPKGEELSPADADVDVRAIGGGSFGLVVRVRDRIDVPRAVKFVRPDMIPRVLAESTGDLGGAAPARMTTDALSSRMADEVRHTNALPFKHVVPIMDYGHAADIKGTKFIYYVSPYIAGQHLDQFLDRWVGMVGPTDTVLGPALHDALLELLDQVLAGLEEMSDAGVAHIDIKPQNTMVMGADCYPGSGVRQSGPTGARVFLIDLGAAVSMRSAAAHPRTALVFTRYYFPLDLMAVLDLHGDTVSTDRLLEWGPRIDLYAVGRMVEQSVLDRTRRGSPNLGVLDGKEETRKEMRWRRVLGGDFQVFEGFVNRLLDTGLAGFNSAREARAAFATLARYSSGNVLTSKLLNDQENDLRINVGGDVVRLSAPLDRAVNHPAFQRLRRLNQLALLSYIYPEATHTRFTHSLRTFDLTRHYVRALSRDPWFRQLCMQRDVEKILAAALLHDVGQYAFSHTIEDLRKIGDRWNVKHLASIRHDQEMARDVMNRRDGANVSIREILEPLDLGDICYMFEKTERDTSRAHALNIGRDLVSGVIDADRVSYLLQDTARTGVPYGGAIDAHQLGAALCICPEGGSFSLAVEERGVSTVEAVLAAVYWMYRNVYWHPMNRGFMAAVKATFATLLEYDVITFDMYFEKTYGRSDWDALVWLHERFRDWNAARMPSDRVAEPLKSIVEVQRFGYTRVYSLGRPSIGTGSLYDRLIYSGSPDNLVTLIDAIHKALPASADVRPGEVLLDIPRKKRLKTISHEPTRLEETRAEAGVSSLLMVRTVRRFDSNHPEWTDLREVSPLAVALTNIEDHSGRKIRVFFSSDLIRRLDKVIETTTLHSIVDGAVTAVAASWPYEQLNAPVTNGGLAV